jgi:starch synthase
MSEITAVHETHLNCPGAGQLRLPVILLGEHKHFASVRSDKEIYEWPNHEPWIAFSRAVVDLLGSSYWLPDVIHCQDSHAALVPVYVKQMRSQQPDSSVSSTRTVLTIHNLLNQGVGPPGIVAYAGLPSELFDVDRFEFYGSANSFKAGLLSADAVSTVSSTYAEEICQSSESGFGLEGVLQGLKDAGRLTGIVNGIDEDRWRMEGAKYDGADDIDAIIQAKNVVRKRLYRQWAWKHTKEPVIAFRSRWDAQKGVALLTECIARILTRAKVVVGVWGTEDGSSELGSAWRSLNQLAEDKSDRLLINPEGISAISDTATHYTMADFFLMPSKYEPCGLVQMECQRYGTNPIVRATGGLADTVSEHRIPNFPSPNGFVFGEMTSDAMIEAVERAVEAFHDSTRSRHLIGNALLQRNGWYSRVGHYEALLSGQQQ